MRFVTKERWYKLSTEDVDEIREEFGLPHDAPLYALGFTVEQWRGVWYMTHSKGQYRRRADGSFWRIR